MKIAVSGAQCTGKSTFLKDFLKRWPNYKTPPKTYRDEVKKKKLKVNREATNEDQMKILNYQIDIAQKYSKDENIIFDRCVLDPLVYSLWLYEKGQGGITDEDIELQIKLVRETLKMYDIIFFTPISKYSPIDLKEDDGKNKLRDTDENFQQEIDNIFNAVMKSYFKQTGVIFPLEDCPPMIEIVGNRIERIKLAELYLDDSGQAFGEDQSLLADALSAESMLF